MRGFISTGVFFFFLQDSLETEASVRVSAKLYR